MSGAADARIDGRAVHTQHHVFLQHEPLNGAALQQAGMGMVSVEQPHAVGREADVELQPLLLQGRLADGWDVHEAHTWTQLFANFLPGRGNAVGHLHHVGVGFADKDGAGEIAVIVPAVADTVDGERHAVYQGLVDHLGRSPVDHHEHASVAAQLGFGEEAGAQARCRPQFPDQLGSGHRRIHILLGRHAHQLDLGWRFGQAYAADGVLTVPESGIQTALSGQPGHTRVVATDDAILQAKLAQSPGQRPGDAGCHRLCLAQHLFAALVARGNRRHAALGARSRRSGSGLALARVRVRIRRRRIGEHQPIVERRLGGMGVVVQERVHQHGQGALGVPGEDGHGRILKAHTIQLGPVVAQIEHVGGMGDHQSVQAFLRHEVAGPVLVHEGLFTQERQVRHPG